MPAVALLHAEAGLTPTGMNGEVPFTNFTVLVENLAFTKLVGIWGHDVSTGNWSFNPCDFSNSVPGNLEIWVGGWDQGTPPDQFDVEYEVLGNIYWDNNGGYNYGLDVAAAGGADGVNTSVIGPNLLVVGSSEVDSAGNLNVDVLVKNIAFTKQVAIVYTTDNWLTFLYAFGTYSRSFSPGNAPHQLQTGLWTVTAPVGTGKTGQFAAFYTVAGATYWDNNFGSNYSF